MTRIRPLPVVVPDEDALRALRRLPGTVTVAEALGTGPYLLLAPLRPDWAGLPLTGVRLEPALRHELAGNTPVYLPPPPAGPDHPPGPGPGTGSGTEPPPGLRKQPAGPPPPDRPQTLDEATASRIAHRADIARVASLLRAGLSVLVVAEKSVVPHLWREMAQRAALRPALLEQEEREEEAEQPEGLVPVQQNQRQRLLARLRTLTRTLKSDQVLVVQHLDLLAGGTDGTLSGESRELTGLVHAAPEQILLAFVAPSLSVPEVLAERFSARVVITGTPRTVPDAEGGAEVPLGVALVTTAEAERFPGFDADDFYKHVAGMNPVLLRQAMRYAMDAHPEGAATPRELYRTIRAFKAQLATNFEVPDVGWEDIAGYDTVKAEIQRAVDIIMGHHQVPPEYEALRGRLIPKGFIFHGPPGTGKTLFAKAIANRMGGTILVVSGPEVTDKYVGESERRVREIFADARRNAPAVIVFDEFDSIAARRSGTNDGASRAGNALVAQILTEMDGFRPDLPVLVIGTTNRLDMIDEALLRPSRFQSIDIGLPDDETRLAMVRLHAGKFGIDVGRGVDLLVADAMRHRNGDDIHSVFRDAFVAEHFQDPPVPPDAEQLGRIVGRLKRSIRERRMAGHS
ncbi:ATP-binding protein [Kitasatospora sp. NPDC047058]|uniref:ATP-binding protein n=1 Tax=Kitasatospora sp. NPDC047058 TaxID=3155620 RepID=UPI0033F47CB4